MILAVSISSYSVIKRSFAVIGFVGVDGVWLLTELCVMAVFSCLILSLSLFSLSSRNGVFSSKSSDISSRWSNSCWFPLYERYFFVNGNRTARPVECMPCTPAHASIDRIFFRHIANAANALVSPHYLFFDISNSYVGIGILLRPCIDPQLCILHSQQ